MSVINLFSGNQLVVLLALAPILLACAIAVPWVHRQRQLNKIPMPEGGSWFLGLRFGLPPNAHELSRHWAHQYGELFRLRIGWYDWVFINSPEAFKEILDRQSIATSSKIPAPIGHDLVTKGLRIFTMPYGPKWRAHRSIMHQLLAPKNTLTFVPSQEFEAKQLLYQLAFDNDDQSSFYQHARRMLFSVIMTSTYGRRIESWDHPDVHAAGESAVLLGKITRPGAFIEDDLPLLTRLPTWMQPSRKAALGYADVVLRGKMRSWNQLKEEVATGSAGPSFAKSIMASDYQNQGLTEEDGAWIAGGLAEAGAEINTVVLHNLILYLAATPEAQKRAAEELDRVVGDTRLPTFADIPRLPYVRACVKEILRVCPVPPSGHKHFTDAEVTYKNYRIPKGTVVVGNSWVIHHDESRYPDAYAFKPERYLDHPLSSAEYATMRDPRARDHFTFGAGRRICPAARLAENTLDIAAASMLWAFQIQPPLLPNGDLGAMDLSDKAFAPGAFRAPKPFRARFIPRDEKRVEIIRREWETARSQGYQLRGNVVSEKAVQFG